MIVPANQATWPDLQAVLGSANCHGRRCYCQRFKSPGSDWKNVSDEERAFRLRTQTSCGDPQAPDTSGLVAYRDGEAVGWAAVEPRTAFGALRRSRVVWPGRAEDKHDSDVWAVTCFHTRPGHRNQGIAGELARATVPFARDRGAKALEAYPMVTEPGEPVPWGEAHVGTKAMFEDAGFVEVSRPTPRRVVMRVDFEDITGGVADRLELAARAAADAGLEVWYCPFTNGLSRQELFTFLADAAERAERLRQTGARVVFLQEQADYVGEMLGIYDAAGVDAAFVYTFARWDLPTLGDRDDEPERDFDAGSFGIVRVLPPGVARGEYAELGWEPKAAFGVVAEFGAARQHGSGLLQ